MTDLPQHSVSVAGVVVRADGRVLAVQRRDNGRWEPPGGVLELDETPEAGVRREVWEETGVDVEVERLTGVYKNMAKPIVALVFRCRPLDTTGAPEPVTSTDEAQRIAWLTPDEIIRIMAPAFAIRVADAFTDFPAVREHDGHNLIRTGRGNEPKQRRLRSEPAQAVVRSSPTRPPGG